MSKAELVSVIQKSLRKDVGAAQAERALVGVIDGIKVGVKKTKSVQLIGFGTFKIASRKARTGAKIKASKTVKFVAGKAFKEILTSTSINPYISTAQKSQIAGKISGIPRKLIFG